MSVLPRTQRAIQLVGPGELVLNESKPVHRPGPYQLLCRVEAAGLCFSDLKLLKQFSRHVRKGPVVSGIARRILDEVPSYVPAERPTVPGHEAVVTIAAVGEALAGFAPGQRFLVQTDYRWLPTAGANAAFGYNFEGALQQYVLMDTRVITDPTGRSMLLPVGQRLSASAVAMVEPWACVEHAYARAERTGITAAGQLLIAAEMEPPKGLTDLFKGPVRPAQVTWLSRFEPPDGLPSPMARVAELASLPDCSFDDIIYLGRNRRTVELLLEKLAPGGLLNVVLCGGNLTGTVNLPVGRVHYEGIRVTGTKGCDPASSMRHVPPNAEIRRGDTICIIGAAGPMGTMHTIRCISSGIEGVSVFAADTDRQRLARLGAVAKPLADRTGVGFQAYDPNHDAPDDGFDYIVLMVPRPEMVAAAVEQARRGAIINIFAGISTDTVAAVDLNSYIEKRLYFVGTSGSVVDDMEKLLSRLESGALQTNPCVAAIAGLDGAIDGLKAVEDHSIPGKIIVYPSCRGLPLTPLEHLNQRLPAVADRLENGLWSDAAEDTLLRLFSNSSA